MPCESELRQGGSFKESLKLLIATTFTALLYHYEIIQTIEENAELCDGQEYCPEATWLPRSEIGRHALSWTSWITNHSLLGRTLTQMVTIWGTIAIVTGLLVFVLKIRGVV